VFATSILLVLGKVDTKSIAKTDRVLFVVAHPDDETMFFLPTIKRLLWAGCMDVFLLCLSSGTRFEVSKFVNNTLLEGDYDGLGQTRKKELFKAAALLGLSQEKVAVVENNNLQV
jgi:N-acetylglucosaminylphosphatidylinositol deacetylase